jgi:hypothetical protein
MANGIDIYGNYILPAATGVKNAAVSLFKSDDAPGDYSSRKASLARQQKLAEMLSQMGAQEIPVSSAGGITAPVSPMGALARGLTSFGGSYLSGRAAADEAGLKKAGSEELAKAVSQFGKPYKTVDEAAPDVVEPGGEPLQQYTMKTPDSGEMLGEASRVMGMGIPGSEAIGANLFSSVAKRQDTEAERERVRAQEAAIPKPAGVSDAAWSAAGGIPGSRTELFNKSLEADITPEKRSAEYTRLVDAGYTPGTPAFNQQMQKFIRKDTYIAPVTGPAPGAPQSYLVDGKPFFGTPQDALALSRQGKIVTTPKTDKPENQFQASSAGFADRMITANKYLTDPAVIAAATSQAQMRRGNVPVIGNYLTSDAKKSLDQAKLSFVNAKLRQESGATIGDSEFVKADLQYFPQPGDGPEQLKQKEIERNIVINGMVRSAGPDYERLDPEKQELEYRRSLRARGG